MLMFCGVGILLNGNSSTMSQLAVKLATQLVCVSRYVAVTDGTLEDK
jgi:uncharacterized membrane protein SirB2